MSHETIVKVIHLTTGGAPIIAKLTPIKVGNEYKLEDPLYLMYSSETGNFSVNDLLALSDESSITIKRDHVMFSYTPSFNLLEHYNNIMINKVERIVDNEE